MFRLAGLFAMFIQAAVCCTAGLWGLWSRKVQIIFSSKTTSLHDCSFAAESKQPNSRNLFIDIVYYVSFTVYVVYVLYIKYYIIRCIFYLDAIFYILHIYLNLNYMPYHCISYMKYHIYNIYNWTLHTIHVYIYIIISYIILYYIYIYIYLLIIFYISRFEGTIYGCVPPAIVLQPPPLLQLGDHIRCQQVHVDAILTLATVVAALHPNERILNGILKLHKYAAFLNSGD